MCKTNVVKNGKAIISMPEPDAFYPFIKKDTVLVKNHSFVFAGKLKYAEQFRIHIIGKNKIDNLTEPFFISGGYHEMTINRSSPPHDDLEVGIGVEIQNEPVNEEYVKKFLPLYNQANKRFDDYEKAMVTCASIKDKKVRNGCLLNAQEQKIKIKKSGDDVLLIYAKANPKSPIIPWLLYNFIWYRGYSESFESVFQIISKHTPENINAPLRNFLTKQKSKAPGYKFALADFAKKDLPKRALKIQYVCVAFWFSGCVPCIAQFDELKRVYKRFKKQGFEIIAISIDKRETLTAYRRILSKKKYPWFQVLDLDGVKTKTMYINSFPTDFLLDSNWTIITTHLSPDLLNIYLESHLLYQIRH